LGWGVLRSLDTKGLYLRCIFDLANFIGISFSANTLVTPLSQMLESSGRIYFTSGTLPASPGATA